MMKEIPSLHIILPGGGVRGCFQGGFLYTLLNEYADKFHIHRVDGTSVGALNGLAFVLNQKDSIYTLWHNIKCIEDIFDDWISVPYFKTVAQSYRFLSEYGFYGNQSLQRIIEGIKDQGSTEPSAPSPTNTTSETLLSRYHCVVTDVHQGCHRYIPGTDPELCNYVLASASPWIITSPLTIGDGLYTDGGLLHPNPTDYMDTEDCDLTVVVGFDSDTMTSTNQESFSSAVGYLSHLIDMVRAQLPNRTHLGEAGLETTDGAKKICIKNPLQIHFLEFDQNAIREGFMQGEAEAHNFAKQYLGVSPPS